MGAYEMETENKNGAAQAGGINESEKPLEELFADLDGILSAMEEREVSLEDSFALYERGMEKIRQCNEKLDLVEKKMLVIEENGTVVPFE